MNRHPFSPDPRLPMRPVAALDAVPVPAPEPSRGAKVAGRIMAGGAFALGGTLTLNGIVWAVVNIVELVTQ